MPLSREKMTEQRQKSFALFYLEDGKLNVSRWSGDVLLQEIGRRFGGFLQPDGDVIRNFTLDGPAGMVLSYTTRFNFAICREYVGAALVITEDQLRDQIAEVELDSKRTIFNNFHAHFPGGSYRARSAREIERYLTGDHRQGPDTLSQIHEDLKLWVEIDKKILELGHSLHQVWEWEHYGKLESDHRDLMITVFVHLLNLGYNRQHLIG